MYHFHYYSECVPSYHFPRAQLHNPKLMFSCPDLYTEIFNLSPSNMPEVIIGI